MAHTNLKQVLKGDEIIKVTINSLEIIDRIFSPDQIKSKKNWEALDKHKVSRK